MRYKPVLRALGLLLVGEAALMLPSLLVALIYREGDAPAFAFSILILGAVGLALSLLVRSKVSSLFAREGFALVGAGWILLSVFGMLPFLFAGVITNPFDAFFETVSGFTTTGASILTNVEVLPHGLLFWRSFTHWVGGMGVLVLTIALLPQLGMRNMEIMRAESPGPTPEKLVPRIRESAKMLYGIYFGMSLLLFLLLLLTDMDPFDALVNTFGTAGTGGFSVLNASIGGYNSVAAEFLIGLFMLLFGVNFAVYYAILARQFKKALTNQELLMYVGVVAAAILVITADILPRVENAWQALRFSAFQVSSIVTTTGFATTDFNAWPMLSRCILLFLMVMGASAGSTGGGVKVVRLLLSFKAVRREVHNILHPRIVRLVTMDGKPVEDTTLRSVLIFMFAYAGISAAAMLVVSLDGFDFVTTFSSVLATMGNIGPGLEIVGPAGNYHAFSNLSKLALSFCMLAGRLEIMPILLLCSPALWRSY